MVAGTRVHVGGLNHDVMDEDIKELFAGVGDLLHCKVRYSLVVLGLLAFPFVCRRCIAVFYACLIL